jgi:hypothetical protein
MKSFNPSLLTHSFRQLTVYEQRQRASCETSPDSEVPHDYKADVQLTLTTARLIATVAGLAETSDALSRLEFDLRSTAEPLSHVRLQHALHHLLELMQSELGKRKVFVIEPEKTKYYQDDMYGVRKPTANALRSLIDWPVPEPQFGANVVDTFPSAYMDIVEAGRCLALNRNNAAIYHLMQVAEVGLRTLAWDRRVTVTRGKKQKEVPLEYAQWGEMIGQIQKKKELIHQWPRSKQLREEAYRYYTRAIFEVDSFNEVYRKHISHARGEIYTSDVAMSCWGNVYRFIEMLSERMSETHRTTNVWNNPKKDSIFD